MYNYIKKRLGDQNEIFEEMVEENSTQNNSLVDGRKRREYVNEEVSNEFNESNKKKISSNTSENNGLVLGGIDINGNKHFYEINKIKEVDDISGTSLNRSSTSLSTNSLPSTKQNVNSKPLQKYFMQENK